MKKPIAYFLLVVFLFGSCKKENQLHPYVSTNSLDNGSAVASKTGNANAKISTAALNTWFSKNPVGRYITPDWTKAVQANVGGVAVVKIPIKAITNISGALNSGGKQVMSSGNTTTQGTLNNFDPNHPPTLYFFKNKLNPGDSLKAVLLNFVPVDSNHENGENNIWTGKLLEWSLESDNVYYQDLDKSYVTSKGSITPTSLSNNSKSIKINSLASFFNDIWNALVWFMEWIGYNIGLPGTYTEYMNGTILTWCVFLGGVLCSGGGGGGDGGGGGGNSYNFVYGSYLLGYNGYFDGSGWQPYATDSGGTPCPGLNATGGIQVMTLPGCPIIPTENTTAGQIISEAATKYGLNGPKRVWLNQHVDAFNLINTYVNLAGLSDAEKAGYFNWAVNYLKDNPSVSLEDFKNQFASQTSWSFNLDAPYSENAENAYKLDEDTKILYPRFAKLVNQLSSYLEANPFVIDAIMYYTGYTKAQVLAMAVPGQGPKIVVQEMQGKYGTYKRYDGTGTTPNVLYISASYVRGLEAANLKTTQQGTAFLLAVTIFHESVHLGRNMTKIDLYDHFDYGLGFERLAFKMIVEKDNAASLVTYTFDFE